MQAGGLGDVLYLLCLLFDSDTVADLTTLCSSCGTCPVPLTWLPCPEDPIRACTAWFPLQGFILAWCGTTSALATSTWYQPAADAMHWMSSRARRASACQGPIPVWHQRLG